MATTWYLLENGAKSTLDGAVLAADATITVNDASTFPATGTFFVTVWDGQAYFDPNDDFGAGTGEGMEIMLVTGVVGNDFTVTRNQGGVGDVGHADTNEVRLLIIAEIIEQVTGALTTHDHSAAGDGAAISHGDLADLSTGADHSWLDQDVTKAATPEFAGLLATDKIKLTQTDGDEYIDSLNDGYVDYGATTAHRFNNDVGLIEDTADTASPKLSFEGGNTRTGTLQQLEDAASLSAFVMDTNGSIELQTDGVARLTVAAGGDVVLSGSLLMLDKIAFTQTDENEYIDSLADGYMDYGATTAHRFNTEVELNGALNHDGATAGFYGTVPIAQALLATGAGATVDNVITALQNLGLAKQA